MEKSEKYNQITTAATQAMLENMTDMAFIKDVNLVYIGASKSFARLVGLDKGEELIGKVSTELFEDEDLAHRYIDDDSRVVSSGKPLKGYIERFSGKNGRSGYCQTSKFPIFDEEGQVIGLYGIAHDVTKQYKARLNYEKELNALFRLPEDALGATFFDVTSWRPIDIRIKDERGFAVGYADSLDELIQNCANSVVDDDEGRAFYSSCTREFFQEMFEKGERRVVIECQRRFSDETALWIRHEFYLMSDPVTDNLCVMAIVIDIDKERREQDALLEAVKQDSLTGIYNRKTTMSRIEEFLKGEGAKGTHFLFMIDVDNFKLVNDTLGHQMGDDTLKYIASSICQVFNPNAIVGRIGGDEFFALLKNAKDAGEACRIAEQLIQILQYECSDGEITIEISGSVGIGKYNGDGKSLKQLYAEADAALYKAKKQGKNQFFFADSVDVMWEEKAPLSTVNLRMLLENAAATMFQTEINEKCELQVIYSSHKMFSNAVGEYKRMGALEEDFWSVILAEDIEPFKQSMIEASREKKILDVSCRVKNDRGEIEWRHVRGTPLQDLGDGKQRMIHVSTDITMQKKMEAELREKNSIVDFAMQNTDVNLWYFDYESTECQLTPSCQKSHEMPGVEVLKNFPHCLVEMGYIRDDCIEQMISAYEKLRTTGTGVSFDVWFKKADGTGWWCEREVLSPLIGADGKVTRCIGIGKDVTAEKVLEERYEAFGTYKRLAEKNVRCSFRMNLTTDVLGDCISGIPEIREFYPTKSVQLFLQMVSQRIAGEEERLYFEKSFLRDRLLLGFADGEGFKDMECLFRVENDRLIWMRILIEMTKNPENGDVEALIYSFDIDHEKNMQFLVERLLEVDYEFLGLIDVFTGHIMVFGKDAGLPGMAKNGGLYEEESKRVFFNLILDEYAEEGMRNMSIEHIIQELEKKDCYSCSFPAKDFVNAKAGRKQWKFVYLDDSKSKILIVRTDITSLYTAEYDPLTGLYNRETFYRRVKILLEENPTEQFLMVRFDIDRFKAYNDVCGTQAGDRLLAAAGRLIRERLSERLAVFGRLEADHFVIAIPESQFSIDKWNDINVGWLREMEEGYRLVSSLGVYKITDTTVHVSLMCDRALLALRTVKDNYSVKVAWYDESLREKLMREQSLTDEMEAALDEGQFVVFFQPQIDYLDGSIIGAEALVRWRHPKHGLIPPGNFIPLFERNGFIQKLDNFVWEKSCEYMRRWHDEGKKVVPISVNVSRYDLYDPELCNRFKVMLERFDLPFSMLRLEITESAYMEDPQQLIAIVENLRTTGFIVEMDDFGAGYSSLNMLKDMPVDVLKLDTFFISETKNNGRAATILSSIIHMAHELNLAVIAEGVETKAQAEALKELQCCWLQGYYFAHPMPVEEFEKRLELVGGGRAAD